MKRSKLTVTILLSIGILAFAPTMAGAHCDTEDGPVITDAKQAIETGNINYISKWVLAEDEQELSEAFEKAMAVRDQSPEAQALADQYLYENLVRIHRAGEGAPYTGVKPAGTSMAEEIVAADHSIEVENLTAFDGLIEAEQMPELEEKFEKVLAKKDFDVDDVEAGRDFVAAYVEYTHFAEGEEHAHEVEGEHTAHNTDMADEHATHKTEEATDETIEVAADEQASETESKTGWLPWSLAGLFFITTIVAHLKKHNH